MSSGIIELVERFYILQEKVIEAMVDEKVSSEDIEKLKEELKQITEELKKYE